MIVLIQLKVRSATPASLRGLVSDLAQVLLLWLLKLRRVRTIGDVRPLVRGRLAHLLVIPLPDLLARIVPHLLTLRLVDAARWRWPLGRVLLVLLA